LWWVDIAGQRVHCFDRSGNDCSWGTQGSLAGGPEQAGRPVVAIPRPGVARPEYGQDAPPRPVDRTDRRIARTTSRSTSVEGPGSARWLTTSGRATPRCTGSTATGPLAWLMANDLQRTCLRRVAGPRYLADTGISVVDVFDMEPATGALSGRRRFLDFNPAQVWLMA
jgi:hypothetical protein